MTSTYDVDDDAIREAQEELRRLEAAESFSSAEVPSVQQEYAPPVQQRRGYAVPGGAVGSPRVIPAQAEAAPVHLSSEPKTLEDLYALFPVGDGDYRLRIERKAPTHFHGPSGAVRVSGFIMDLDVPISMTDFAARFGGQRYEVSVIGPPSATQRVDASGNRVVRLLKKVEIAVPGAPKLTYLPAESKEENNAMQPQQYIGSSHPEVEKARIEADSARAKAEVDERRRYADEARTVAVEAARTPEKFLVAVREQNERSISEVKSLAQQQVDLLRTQNAQLRDDYFKLREESDKLRVQLVQVQQETDRRARESETEKIAALKNEQEREIRRIHEERASQLDKLAQQHRDDLTRITNQHTEELRRAESAASKERDLLVRDGERRENQSVKDAERERAAMRETYESRISQLKDTLESRIRDIQSTSEREIASLKDSKEREIASLKESRERELLSVRNQWEMQASVARDTASLRIENVNAEMQRLRDDVQRQTARADAAEREAQDLRAASHKEPVQAIEEAKGIVQLVGWGPREEKSTEEGEFDWKKTLAKAGMGLVDKLPEITRDVIASRQPPGGAQGQVGQLPQWPPGSPPPRMLQGPPPQGYYQQQQSPPPPRPRQPSFVLPFPSQQSRAPMPQPMYSQQPQAYQAFPAQQQQVPQQAYQPFPAQQQPPQQAFAAPPPPSPQQQAYQPFPVQQPSQPQPQPQPQPVAPEIKPEHLAEFLQELEVAIRDGVIPVGVFARGFVERVGRDNASSLIQMFTPDSLIASVQAQDQSNSTAIVTRDGQRYVRELWFAVQQTLGQPVS